MQKIKFPNCRGYVFINPCNIIKCTIDETNRTHSIIHLREGTEERVSIKLGKVEERLPIDCFFRVHREAIVNLSAVKTYENGIMTQLTLSEGLPIRIANGRLREFLNQF